MSLRRILMGMLACAVLFASDARAVLPPKYGGILTVRIQEKFSTIDPAMAVRPDEFAVVFCLFETLVKPDGNGGLTPVLLDGLPKTSGDGLTYYFKLKKDITFHDGSVLDPADVMHTIERVARSRRSPYSWLFDSVEGAADFRSGKARTISGFKIVDSLRFEIKIRKKNSAFLKYLALPAAAIVPTNDREFRPPIGTGPFKFMDMRAGGDITLSAHAGHHEGRPYLDGIKFKVFRSDDDALVNFKAGELSVTAVPLDGLGKDVAAAYGKPVKGPMRIIWMLDVNPSDPPLTKPSARRAMAKAVDRRSIVDVVLNGNGRVEDNSGGGAAPDPVQAAGTLSLWYPDRGKAPDFLAERLQRDLRRAGVTVAPEARKGDALYRFTSEDAPDLVLRPLPMLLGLSETVEKTLYSKGHKSSYSTMALRLAGHEAADPSQNKYLILFLFSQETGYIAHTGVRNFSVGAFNQPEFDAVFIRKR